MWKKGKEKGEEEEKKEREKERKKERGGKKLKIRKSRDKIK